MLIDKRQTIIDRSLYAIREIQRNDVFSALTLILSLEQTAIHCGARSLMYLLPKAYVLLLCGYQTESMMVLRHVVELATYVPKVRSVYVMPY